MDRLWAKVTIGDCWHWTGAVNSHGYGSFWLNGTSAGAHRVVYELLVEPIPDGMVLDHQCRNRACVNPDHLEVVTSGDNTRRGVHPNSRKQTCPRGHVYSGVNARGDRVCSKCRR